VAGYQITQSVLLEGRGIRLHTSQLQKRKVSNFGRGITLQQNIRFQQKYQITTGYQVTCRRHFTPSAFSTPFCVDYIAHAFVQVCASFCNISNFGAMLPDLTDNVSILALSSRQPRQQIYRLHHRFS
jgi:hypothetical protein